MAIPYSLSKEYSTSLHEMNNLLSILSTFFPNFISAMRTIETWIAPICARCLAHMEGGEGGILYLSNASTKMTLTPARLAQRMHE